jgi:hypothetical protein
MNKRELKEELKERVWQRLRKKKEYKNYAKTGRFYIVEFPIVFNTIWKVFSESRNI